MPRASYVRDFFWFVTDFVQSGSWKMLKNVPSCFTKISKIGLAKELCCEEEASQNASTCFRHLWIILYNKSNKSVQSKISTKRIMRHFEYKQICHACASQKLCSEFSTCFRHYLWIILYNTNIKILRDENSMKRIIAEC